MKRYKVTIITETVGSKCEDFFEMPDDATEKEIEAEASEVAFNLAEWHYEEVTARETPLPNIHTGFFDNTGTEICVGDILEMTEETIKKYKLSPENKNNRVRVAFDAYEYRVYDYIDNFICPLSIAVGRVVKVIGNVRDTPDILKA